MQEPCSTGNEQVRSPSAVNSIHCITYRAEGYALMRKTQFRTQCGCSQRLNLAKTPKGPQPPIGRPLENAESAFMRILPAQSQHSLPNHH